MLNHHRHASETSFKWRFAGGSVIAPLIPSSTKKQQQQQQQKQQQQQQKRCKSCTPSGKTFWIRACWAHPASLIREVAVQRDEIANQKLTIE